MRAPPPVTVPAALARGGLIDPAPVARLWRDHQAGRANHGRRLWTVLMFQSWLDNRRRGRAPAAALARGCGADGLVGARQLS